MQVHLFANPGLLSVGAVKKRSTSASWQEVKLNQANPPPWQAISPKRPAPLGISGLLHPRMRGVRFGNTSDELTDMILGAHDRSRSTLNALEKRWKALWKTAVDQKKWLDPQAMRQLHLVVANEEKFLKFLARGGFLSRYRYFGHGQELYRLKRSQFRHPVFELTAYGRPSFAFMVETLPLYVQSAIMARTLAASDFVKNNLFFAQGPDDMLGEMARHKDAIAGIERQMAGLSDRDYLNMFGGGFVQSMKDRYKGEYKIKLGQKIVEDFLNQVESIKWLIDFTAATPRKPRPPEQARAFRQALVQNREKFPPCPERDVLGFLIEHSPVLQGWQRRILSMIREESYYFANDKRTELMRKGWQTFWMTKLLHEVPDLLPSEEIAPAERFMYYFYLQPDRQRLQFNLIGYKIWEDIFRRASLDVFDRAPDKVDWEKVFEKEPDEARGLKVMRQIRSLERDETFVKHYLTPWVAQELDLYGHDTGIVSTKHFETIRDRVAGLLANGGEPVIQIVNDNYDNNGGLMLTHVHKGQDLKITTAKQTLRVLQQLWGKPVLLSSKLTLLEEEDDYRKRLVTLQERSTPPTPEELERQVTIKPVVYVATGQGEVGLYEVDGASRHELDDAGKRKSGSSSGGYQGPIPGL